MNIFALTTNYMDLGTVAANSCLFALTNPVGSGRSLLIRRLVARGGFVGAPAATKIDFGLTRATGTPAAGSSSKATSAIARRNPGNLDGIATFKAGPTPITGLTADTPSDFKTWHIAHQVGPVLEWDLIHDEPERMDAYDPFVVLPGTSLAVFNRTVSVAGSGLEIDCEYSER